jgi:hypothetical protein
VRQGGEYEVEIASISNWKPIPAQTYSFKEAVSFLLTPFMEKEGFSTEGVTFNGDGYQIEFEGESACLSYHDFGRLDPPSLSFKVANSGWMNYEEQVRKHFKSILIPELTDYPRVIRIIESTFLSLVETNMNRYK